MRGLALAVAVSMVPWLIPLAGRDDSLLDVSSILGLLGLTLLWWQMVLGAPTISRTVALDREVSIAAHTALGVGGLLVIALHPLLWRLADDQPWSFLWRLDVDFVEVRWVSLGRIALASLLIVWLTSTIARYAVRYRWWRSLHYLTYPTTALVFLHSYGATGLIDSHPALQAYWWVLAITLTLALATAVGAQLGAPPARLVGRRIQGDLALLEIGGAARKLKVGPGQFVLVRMHRLSTPHPFTVVGRGPDQTLRLAVARRGRHTQQLAVVPVGERLWVSGPYGALLRDLETHEQRVLLAGGVGITPFVSYLDRAPDLSGTHLFHLTRDPMAELLSPRSRQRLGSRYHVVNSSVRARLTVTEIDPQLRHQAAFWICGSPTFVEAWERQLRRNGVHRRRIHSERFE